MLYVLDSFARKGTNEVRSRFLHSQKRSSFDKDKNLNSSDESDDSIPPKVPQPPQHLNQKLTIKGEYVTIYSIIA